MSGWYPRLNAQGRVVSGAGVLFLDGQPLGEIGWNPVWFNDGSFIYNAARDGLRIYDLASRKSFQLDARELIELAAGGGMWAGRHAPSNTLVVSGGGEIPSAGQPCLSSRGELIYRVGDDKIEPSICLTAAAWGDGRGRIFAHTGKDVTVGPFEANPELVDTREGAWVFCMSSTGFHLRPLFGSVGYAIYTGNNCNLNAHAICDGNVVKCVWQDNQGRLLAAAPAFEGRLTCDFDLSEPRVQLPVSTPIVLPDPKPEEPPVADIDISKYLVNRIDVVEAVKRDYSSLTGGAIVDQVAHRLNREHGLSGDQIVFGRKARNFDGSNPNDDALAIRRSMTDISQKAYVDLLVGDGHDTPRWGVIPENEEAGNGFWRPPVHADLDVGGGDNGDPGDEDDTPEQPPACNCAADITQLRAALAELDQVIVDAAKAANDRLTKLETAPEKPLPALVVRVKYLGEFPVVPK